MALDASDKQFLQRLLVQERVANRQMVREEVSAQLEQKLEQKFNQKLQPIHEKLDQLMTAETEDVTALATDHVALTDRVDDHEGRLKKLEIKPT